MASSGSNWNYGGKSNQNRVSRGKLSRLQTRKFTMNYEICSNLCYLSSWTNIKHGLLIAGGVNRYNFDFSSLKYPAQVRGIILMKKVNTVHRRDYFVDKIRQKLREKRSPSTLLFTLHAFGAFLAVFVATPRLYLLYLYYLLSFHNFQTGFSNKDRCMKSSITVSGREPNRSRSNTILLYTDKCFCSLKSSLRKCQL